MNTVVRWPPALLVASSRPSIPLHRPGWQRLASALREHWAAWRAASRARAEIHALAALDRRVLRDIGLAELVPPRQEASWLDLERARW